MAINPIATPGTDLAYEFLKPGVHHLNRPAALAADDVMVMHPRRAGDVCVLARREVDALQLTLPGQQVERPEDRRATDAHVSVLCVGKQLCRSEVSAALRDQGAQRSTRACLARCR